MNVFRNEASHRRLAAWYPRFRARIPGPVETRDAETRHGRTHVLLAGPPDAPPLVVVHGALASSAHAVPEIAPLLDRFRIIAPDLPGQSPMSADVRLPLDGAACGGWLTDVLNAVAVPRAALLGVSWGGHVALRAAAHAPDRFTHLVLLVPAGIVATPAWPALRRVALPMLGWRLFSREASLRAFADATFTTPDEDWVRWIGDALHHYRTDFAAPPLATPADVAGFRGPVLVFGAEHDLSFPGDALLARARELFPHAETERIAGSKHAPPMDDTFRAWLSERVARFLGERERAVG